MDAENDNLLRITPLILYKTLWNVDVDENNENDLNLLLDINMDGLSSVKFIDDLSSIKLFIQKKDTISQYTIDIWMPEYKISAARGIGGTDVSFKHNFHLQIKRK